MRRERQKEKQKKVLNIIAKNNRTLDGRTQLQTVVAQDTISGLEQSSKSNF